MNKDDFYKFGCTIAAALLLAFAPGCHRSGAESRQPAAPSPPVTVQVTRPSIGPITRSIVLPAVIKANQQVTLYAKTSGFLRSIRADRGDRVEAGAELAEIEAPELIAEQARCQAEVEVARSDYQRLAEAQKKAPDLVMPLAVESAKGKLEVAAANLRKTDTLLGYTRIVAPFSGTVTRRWADVGALIPAATASSSPQSAALFTLVDQSKVRVEVAIPAPEAPLVKIGLRADLRVEELPGKSFTGEVTRFAGALDEATRTMMAEVELPNETGELRAGMFGAVKLVMQHKPEALLLPGAAVVIEKARASVFLLVDGRAKKKPVKIGFEDGTSVEVLEGVAPGDAVIVAGKLALADGQLVKAP